MPYRFFTADEAARYLNFARCELDRLVKEGTMPFEKRGDRIVFRRADLDAWASRGILSANTERLVQYRRRFSARRGQHSQRSLDELIAPEQIDSALTARTKPSVIRDLVSLAASTGHVCDPAELVESLEAREASGSTAMPGGLALLHPRTQHPYRFETSFVVLGRAVHPIHFGAPDREPTDLFFLLCCQEEGLHLHLLARLCLLAHESGLLSGLRAAAEAQGMYECLVQADEDVLKASDLAGKHRSRG